MIEISLGNKRNWWTSASEAEFNNRTKCLEDLYSTYSGQVPLIFYLETFPGHFIVRSMEKMSQ